MIRRVIVFTLMLIACALCFESSASAEPALSIARGRYLWNVWRSPLYGDTIKDHYKTWPAFRDAVSDLNGLPRGDAAYRHLAAGTQLKLPVSIFESSDLSNLRKQANDLKQKVSAGEQKVSELTAENAKLKTRVRAVHYSSNTAWIIAAIVLGVLCIIFLALYVRERGAARTIRGAAAAREGHLEAEIKTLQSTVAFQKEFLERHTTYVRLPPYVEREKGDANYVYFQNGPPVEGARTVYVFGMPEPVKADEVPVYFTKMDKAALGYYGLRKKSHVQRPDDMKS